MNILTGFFAVLLISIVTVMGDFFMKLAGNSSEYMRVGWFVYGMILYLITGFGWFMVMKIVKLSSIGVIYGVTTSIVLALIGILIFHEKMNFIEIIAIMMGLISIFLLIRFN